jgi:hypothetical protein
VISNAGSKTNQEGYHQAMPVLRHQDVAVCAVLGVALQLFTDLQLDGHNPSPKDYAASWEVIEGRAPPVVGWRFWSKQVLFHSPHNTHHSIAYESE